MFNKASLVSFAFLAVALGQQIGTVTPEVHPPLTIQQCTAGGTCTTETRSIVIDANWRWTHNAAGTTNCYDGNTWNAALCPDPVTCAANCGIDGANYAATYGITTSGSALTMNFVTTSSTRNVGSRVYLLDDADDYKLFNLKNQEFTFDVDVSKLPCGLNGAVYFVEMDQDGGKAKYPTNKAGARYGTGYCDSQCPHDIKFIDGKANTLNWTASANDINSGTGLYGSCCAEMDIWEANSISAAYTPHPCSVSGQTQCSGIDCGDGADRYNGVCDKDGCDFNSYRQGDQTFLGPGKTINTNTKFTLVTQFITSDGTAAGDLVEIKRFYVQNGVVHGNSVSTYPTLNNANSITEAYCTAQKTLFGDTNSFEARGGLASMGDSFEAGMTLVLSLWDDHAVNMLWLDSTYPTTSSPTAPGVARGSCATTSGDPKDVEANSPNASVTYSNIKYGPLNSTFTGTTAPVSSSASASSSTVSTSTSSTSSAPPSSSTGAAHYAQCGGQGYTGPTTCVSPYTCVFSNAFFSQCL